MTATAPLRFIQDEPKTTTAHRMTEVIIPQGQNSNAIVFPLVASLSKQVEETVAASEQSQRWVTWITDRKPSTQQIHNLGASTDALRIIHTKTDNDCRWIMWEALKAGNSHTVIADMSSISEKMTLRKWKWPPSTVTVLVSLPLHKVRLIKENELSFNGSSILNLVFTLALNQLL